MDIYLPLFTMFLDDPPDFIIFLGRFHPLVVHLPIGFLMLAVIGQFAIRWPKFHPLKPFIHYVWGLGALSAAFTVIFGYFLSLSGNYDDDLLFWHKWSGVGVFLISLGCYFFFKKQVKAPAFITWSLVIMAGATLGYTGHLGGNLTHGSTYLLEYAPNSIRDMAGMPPKMIPRKKVTEIDSADVFLDVVLPIMTNKCVSCHNTGKKKGDLLLTDYSNMMKGGENGVILVPGDVEASELYRRITLAETHDDFMPSEGKRPLSEQEVELLEWWISYGCPPEGYLNTLEVKDEIVAKVSSYLGLDKNSLLSQRIEPAKESIKDSLRGSGFVINRLMIDNYFLEANFGLSERDITDGDIQLLTGIKDQLIWLDVSNSNLKDVQLEQIAEFQNLIKLNLSGTKITDHSLQHLSKLTQLESLNLYNTEVSNTILEVIPKLTRLKSIYLWKTKVNDSVIGKLQATHKNLRIVNERLEGIE